MTVEGTVVRDDGRRHCGGCRSGSAPARRAIGRTTSGDV